jgi:hypothetical protein
MLTAIYAERRYDEWRYTERRSTDVINNGLLIQSSSVDENDVYLATSGGSVVSIDVKNVKNVENVVKFLRNGSEDDGHNFVPDVAHSGIVHRLLVEMFKNFFYFTYK